MSNEDDSWKATESNNRNKIYIKKKTFFSFLLLGDALNMGFMGEQKGPYPFIVFVLFFICIYIFISFYV